MWLIPLVLLLGIPAEPLQPQGPTRVYLPNAADEDWSFLKRPEARTDRWDGWKYIPFGGEDRFLTLSGEVRYRPEGLRIRGDGESPATTDTYLLQRYLFGADLRLGRRVRLFAELQAGIINGRLGSPRPRDRDTLDLHQAFVEFRRLDAHRRGAVVKLGRHELAIGSSRLISASPGLNVKRSFDGATFSYRRASWSLSGAAARLVGIQAGVFDDRSSREQVFWGLAAGRPSPWLERGEVGVYYLGIDKERAEYAQGAGPESRHTLGAKWSGAAGRFGLNYDAVVQWGRFGGAPVRAWAFASETGYRVSATGWKPRLGVRSDVASGDRDGDDPRLESFNPLFPGNSYAGAVGLLGPTNLTDLTPSVTLFPRGGLVLGVEAPSYWRTSVRDGIYSTDIRLLVPPGAGTGRYVGTNPGVFVTWQITRHLQVQGVATRFISGRFLERTFVAKGFGFYSASGLYRF